VKPLTAYQEVKQKITDDLVRGHYPTGQALPAEKDLAKELEVSIGTLRKAVDELVAEGLLSAVKAGEPMLQNMMLSDCCIIFSTLLVRMLIKKPILV